MPVKGRFALVAGLLLTILTPIVVVALPASLARLAFSLLLVCFLPGWGAVEGLFALYGRQPRLSERLLFGWGVSYVVTMVGGLWLYYAFGRLSLAPLLALYTIVGVAGFGLAWLRSGGSSAPVSSARAPAIIDVVCLGGLLALTAYLIFYSLSYADFRGDEAEVILRAVAVIRGVGQPILTHTKGPAEVLLVAAGGVLNGGVFDEFSARLPFSLAGWLAVTGAFVLGYRLFGRRTALMGSALLTVNGWLVTHGHLAQYQDLVLLLSILAVWCYARFYEEGAHIYHLLGTLFLATAALSHYEGLAAAPAILYLLILGSKKRWGSSNEPVGWNVKKAWPLALSLAAGAAIILSFYVPFILNPAVAGAQSTLAKRFGGSPPYDNWDIFYIDALSFNSIYYTLGVGVALLGGTLLGIRRVVGGGRRDMAAVAGALPLLLLSWTGLLPPWYALLVYLILMGLFLLSRRVSVFVKTMLLWILLPFGLYLFVVARPGNHFYTIMPPLMLLAALALDKGLGRLESWDLPVRRWVLPAATGGLLVLYGLSTWYEQLLFVRTDLEYMLTYPQHRQPAFWTDLRFPYDIRIGWGYPYRLGWQTIAELYRSGQLAGDWYGTDENNSILWYTLGWPRNPCYPRYFMVSEIGYNDPPLKVPQDTIDRYYALRAVVQVNGQARLRLYEFSPLGNQVQPVIYYDEPASYPTLYRQEMLQDDTFPATLLSPSRRFKPHPDMLARMADAYGDPRIVQVKDEATLLGYDVDDTWAVPGGVLLLTLHWRADRNLIFSYKVFTHVADGERTLAQADGEPGCGELPTNRWVAGDQVIDRHAIFLPTDMPPGDYALQVGVYEARTDLRMDVLDSAGHPAGNSLLLNGVTVRPKK